MKNNWRMIFRFILIWSAFGLVGCASGPKYTEVNIPALNSGYGRIYFYRDSSFVGAAVTSKIKLNDKPVGKSVPGGFFYVDTKPGGMKVSCKTETTKTIQFLLESGDERYIRTRVSMGVFVGHITPHLEGKEEAAKTLHRCSYIGDKLISGGG